VKQAKYNIFVQIDEHMNMTGYFYHDVDCKQPDSSMPPVDSVPALSGCINGVLQSVTDGRPHHPYANVVKYYSFANCKGVPLVWWQVPSADSDPPYCLYSRDPDYPSTNVPFWVDCLAGTYAVFNSNDDSRCNNDMRNVVATGSLGAFRYYGKCVADYEYPVTPRAELSCGGYVTP
jgi:hypothetical protein